MITKVAVFAGSFAPFTNGHADILDRALGIFDTVVVLVTANPEKNIPAKDLLFHASLIDSYAKEKYGDASVAYPRDMNGLHGCLHHACVIASPYKVIVVPRLETNGVPIMVTEFAAQIGAVAMVRGIRNEVDYCYEQNLVNVNSVLEPRIQTVWLPCDPRLACVSSTVVRGVRNMGGSIDNLVPTVIAQILQSPD